MDYMHGDVSPDEETLACYWEYARESRTLWAVAETCVALQKKKRWSRKRVLQYLLVERSLQQWWPRTRWAYLFLASSSFPKKDWQELAPKERRRLCQNYDCRTILPLAQPPGWALKALGRVFLRSKTPVAPTLQKDGPTHYVVFEIGFSESETQLLRRLREWLRLPQNLKRLRQYATPKGAKGGTAGQERDRLKDLAVWRLFRELKDWSKANDFANTHRKNKRAFHGARLPQTPKNALNETELGNGESYCRHAEGRAKEFLSHIMPSEFMPPALAQEAFDKAFPSKPS